MLPHQSVQATALVLSERRRMCVCRQSPQRDCNPSKIAFNSKWLMWLSSSWAQWPPVLERPKTASQPVREASVCNSNWGELERNELNWESILWIRELIKSVAHEYRGQQGHYSFHGYEQVLCSELSQDINTWEGSNCTAGVEATDRLIKEARSCKVTSFFSKSLPWYFIRSLLPKGSVAVISVEVRITPRNSTFWVGSSTDLCTLIVSPNEQTTALHRSHFSVIHLLMLQ